MKALVWQGEQDLTIEDVAVPEVDADHALFEVTVAGICGSDLHGYRGHPGPRVPPLILGHEAVGRVAGRAGLVVPFPLWSCGACTACREGDMHLCPKRGLLGLDRPGVFAESVAVPIAALVDVPERVSPLLAALTEPMAVGVSALRLDGVAPGDRVLVIGGGPIGLLTAHAAMAAGAEVDLLEPLERRRQIAGVLGVRGVFADAQDVSHAAYDVAYDTVGIQPAWSTAINAVRRGGRATIIGLGQDEGPMAVGAIVRNAVTVRGHYAYTRADFDAALQLLAEHPVDVSWLETMSLDDGAAAFERLVSAPGEHVKCMLEVRS